MMTTTWKKGCEKRKYRNKRNKYSYGSSSIINMFIHFPSHDHATLSKDNSLTRVWEHSSQRHAKIHRCTFEYSLVSCMWIYVYLFLRNHVQEFPHPHVPTTQEICNSHRWDPMEPTCLFINLTTPLTWERRLPIYVFNILINLFDRD